MWSKSWLTGKDPDAGEDWRWEKKEMTEDEMVGWHQTQWTWVWVDSGSWWWIGRPGVLQSMGLQRVTHNSATELNARVLIKVEGTVENCIKYVAYYIIKLSHLQLKTYTSQRNKEPLVLLKKFLLLNNWFKYAKKVAHLNKSLCQQCFIFPAVTCSKSLLYLVEKKKYFMVKISCRLKQQQRLISPIAKYV